MNIPNNENNAENNLNYYDSYWYERFMSRVDVSFEKKQIEGLSAKVEVLESK